MPRRATHSYRIVIDESLGIRVEVEFKRENREVIDYSVVLVVDEDGVETVRLYDGSHGTNELHRYTRSGGKQEAEVFHAGSLGGGMRTAIQEIKDGYEAMIDSWRRG